MRIARIGAVSGREIVRSLAGRRGWSFAVVALGLLIPAGTLRLPGRGAPGIPRVRGEVPAALEGRVALHAGAAVELVAGPPVTVRAERIGPALRAALETLEAEPAVERRFPTARPVALPRRTLLIALLAISLLTGPLAETLPGEREGRTLEVLLASSLSRGEIVVGKWLAWTGVASAAALLAGLGGLATGALAAGSWIPAVPAALAVAVALGLWLVRGAADLVGGAAAPMRVLPVVAVGAFASSWALLGGAPLLAAAVPLGGALLVGSGLLGGLFPSAIAVAMSLVTTAILLWRTTRALDQQGARPAERSGRVWASLLFAASCWWLAVAGPATFLVGGATRLPAPAGASLTAGGLLLSLVAAVTLARDGRWPVLGGAGCVPLAGAVGCLLAVAGAPRWPASGGRLSPLLEQLGDALDPLAFGPLAVVAVVVGHELFFRGALQRHLGVFASALAWVVVVCPMAPLFGLLSGLTLGLLHARAGLLAALVAHGAWALAQPWVGGHGGGVTLACGGLAVALAAVAPTGTGRPGRRRAAPPARGWWGARRRAGPRSR